MLNNSIRNYYKYKHKSKVDDWNGPWWLYVLFLLIPLNPIIWVVWVVIGVLIEGMGIYDFGILSQLI